MSKKDCWPGSSIMVYEMATTSSESTAEAQVPNVFARALRSNHRPVLFTPANPEEARFFKRISGLDHHWPPRHFQNEAALWAAAAAYAIEFCHTRRGAGENPRVLLADIGGEDALSLGQNAEGCTWQDVEEAATMAFVRYHRALFP
ncbi:MAG: hypothetical protein AAF220_02550 [Pseudomonadota bacterium]